MAAAAGGVAEAGTCNIEKELKFVRNEPNRKGDAEKYSLSIRLIDETLEISNKKMKGLGEEKTLFPPLATPPWSPAQVAESKAYREVVKQRLKVGTALLKKFHEETTLFEIIAARNPDCGDCIYAQKWAIFRDAGYPYVTLKEMAGYSEAALAAIKLKVVAYNGAKKADFQKELGIDQMKEEIEQAFVTSDFGEPMKKLYDNGCKVSGLPGFCNGYEYAARMEKILKNYADACPPPLPQL